MTRHLTRDGWFCDDGFDPELDDTPARVDWQEIERRARGFFSDEQVAERRRRVEGGVSPRREAA